MGGFIPLNPKDTAVTKKMELLRKKEASKKKSPSKSAVDAVNTIDSDETIAQNKIDSVTVAKEAFTVKTPPTDIITLFKDWQKVQVMNGAKNSVSSIMTSIDGKKQELNKRYEIHRRHIFSLHEKYALALSCIILFFVGAPLGAIIRKGGIGLPMVVAILLFLVYYFLGVFAENYSYKGNIHPIIGAWLSSMVMLPLGIYLTRQATADQGMMNFGNVIDFVKRLFSKKDKNEEE